MQILLGAYKTIIKINSSLQGIVYIQNFISAHFKESIIKENYIHIPFSKHDCAHRLFLLKWIYALYVKKTNNHIPELKTRLIKRYKKTIKIELKEKTIYKIFYQIIDKQRIDIKISPYHHQIVYEIKKYLKVDFKELSNILQATFTTKEQKEALKKFITNSSRIKIPHKHIYNHKLMKEFINSTTHKAHTNADPLTKACIVLGISKNPTKEIIKKQFRNLVKLYHPDKVAHKDKKTIALYTEKFQNILQAYEIAKNSL